jgi:hypothetical protein
MAMNVRNLIIGLIAGSALGGGLAVSQAMAQNEQFIPRLVYRTGPYAPNGIPFADGYADYLDMINARDGGINGVKLVYEECEDGYDNTKGVEWYDWRLVRRPSLDRHHLCADRARRRRQDPDGDDGLWPRRCQLWSGVPL